LFILRFQHQNFFVNATSTQKNVLHWV
jgi:hypothetical protein